MAHLLPMDDRVPSVRELRQSMQARMETLRKGPRATGHDHAALEAIVALLAQLPDVLAEHEAVVLDLRERVARLEETR